MMWSSNQRKNYLHLAAERGLPKVLRLLLERARSENFGILSPKIILTGCKESLRRKLRKLTSLDSCQVVGDFEIERIV